MINNLENLYWPANIISFEHSIANSNELIRLHKEVVSKQNILKKIDVSDSKYPILKKEIEDIKSSIKFLNPYIYFRYEALAFVWTDEFMENLWDLIDHCSINGSICNKRFDMINNALKSKYWIDLFDENRFPRNIGILELLS